MHDQKEDLVVEPHVYVYKREKDYLYVIGKSGYTKVKYEGNIVKQSSNLNDFSDDHKNAFIKLK